MLRALSNRIAVLALTALLFGAVHARALDISNGGTVISKHAEATFQNEAGESCSTASATGTVTRFAIAVPPHETAPSNTLAPHKQAARAFRVCNAGNTPDTFAVTHVDVTAPATVDGAYFVIDGNGVVKNSDAKITLNEDKSPQLQPGGCVAVLVLIRTNDVAPHSTVTMNLAVRSHAANAASGHGEDIGTISNAVDRA